ncbi:MAG: class IV adenylate cyclase [Clostridia bacterium]|nr:class IV adenylate cyclase [Clostridia bacterium]
MQDKEVELKFQINNNTKDAILEFLKTNGTALQSFRMIDTYYIPNFREFEINGETHECVRIREKNDKAILCYKKIHREANPIYCDEYELIVSSKADMEKILFALGFTIQMVIDKTRTSYSYQDFRFDFDDVVGLDPIMEIELTKAEDMDISKIYNFVEKYGLGKDDVTYEGIQVMMKKANLI